MDWNYDFLPGQKVPILFIISWMVMVAWVWVWVPIPIVTLFTAEEGPHKNFVLKNIETVQSLVQASRIWEFIRRHRLCY